MNSSTRLRVACVLSLLLAFSAPAAASTVQTFNNTSPITINVQGNATPYPSNIVVSGVPNAFTRLEVRLNGFSHTFPDDVDILLVGPQGQRAILMSDAGGNVSVTGLGLIFAQTASGPLPGETALTTGTFRPTNFENVIGDAVDTFPTPGPGALTDASADLGVFAGTNPNGFWNLFVVDDASGDPGSISGGWTLAFTVPTVFTVTKTADTNDGACNADCSLREAITAAQNGDLINFSSLFNTPQSINLPTALPEISRSITIQGPGANLLAVRRDFGALTDFRIFTIAGGVSNGVALSGMTTTGGNVGGSDYGGGIDSQSHLTLTNVHVAGNTAGIGGGVSLTFADGAFTNCTFSNNTSTNAAGLGGGILHQGEGGRTLRVVNSTISGNRGANTGGGIVNFSGSAGGNSRLEITNSTIAGNTAGGVQTFTQINATAAATTTLRNTIITGNSPTNLAAGTVNGGPATFQTLGFNLSDNFNGVFTPLASDITSATPRLAPLALYGGQTPTHALLHASPAINAGDASGATTDQRGVARVFGAFADIGAVEMRPLVVTSTANSGSGSLFNILGGGGNGPLTDIQFENGLFSSPQTITRTGGQLSINFNANLIGPSANLLTISGNNNSRIFQVPAGITATLSGMTVTGGNGSGGDGGGIFNGGNLTVSHSTVTNNSSPSSGGGILNGAVGILSVSNSTISRNQASGIGGGIFSDGTASIINSTISGNSSFATNFSSGGVDSGGNTTIINSTITDNSAAGVNPGGVSRFNGTVNVRNSIIAGNVGNATKPDVVANGGTGITSNGFNLIGNRGTVAFGATGDQAGGGGNPILNPLLGELQNNGGTTATHDLLAGSPALDQGNGSGATSDQRGLTRPFDLAGITNASDGADIGAVERQRLPASISLTTTVGTANGVCATTSAITVTAGTTVFYCFTVTNTGNVAVGQHSLIDNQLGGVFNGIAFALNPGSNVNTVALGQSIAAVVNTTTTNTGTWTASNPGPVDVATASASATVTVAAAPIVAFTPTAGSTINFPTGTAGTATSSIAVSSSGGVAPGTVNVANCSPPAGFSITNAPINLTGTAGGAQISGSINLSCTRGASLQTGSLSCSETPTPGTAVTRNWTLSCPAATVTPVAPTVAYAPVAGSSINFPTGVAGTATSSIAVSSSGGVAPGTVNVSACVAPTGFTITNAPINLTGTAGGSQISGSINLTCTRGAVVQSGSFTCNEAPTPGTTVARSWTLTCPVAAGDPIFGNGFEG